MSAVATPCHTPSIHQNSTNSSIIIHHHDVRLGCRPSVFTRVFRRCPLIAASISHIRMRSPHSGDEGMHLQRRHAAISYHLNSTQPRTDHRRGCALFVLSIALLLQPSAHPLGLVGAKPVSRHHRQNNIISSLPIHFSNEDGTGQRINSLIQHGI